MSFDPVQYMHEKTNLALYYQNALGFAFPPIYPLKNVIKIPTVEEYDIPLGGILPIKNFEGKDPDENLQKYLPVIQDSVFVTKMKFQRKEEGYEESFMFPTDPLVSISCKNKIVRRNVAKSGYKGTIKESWNQDDYEINISGLLQTDKNSTVQEYQKKLIAFCETKKSISVYCTLLQEVFNIKTIAIEDYSFAFTKGEENQLFSIKAYSDEPYDLLIQIQ